jgi:hypothetical protein
MDRAAKSNTENQALVATMSDGKHCMKVLVLNPSGAFTGYVVEMGKDWNEVITPSPSSVPRQLPSLELTSQPSSQPSSKPASPTVAYLALRICTT